MIDEVDEEMTAEMLRDEKREQVLTRIDELLRTLQAGKPNDRSELDKIYAVAITDVQRVYAWWSNFAYLGFPTWQDSEDSA